MSASQGLVELEEYASASNGLPDPSLEAVGLIPVVGALKNVDEVAALVKAFRQGENLLGNLGDSARAGSRLALAGAGAAENAGTLNRVSESFDAAADATHAAARLAESGETVTAAAKTTGRTVDGADEAIDNSNRKTDLTKVWTQGGGIDNIGIKHDEDLNIEPRRRFRSEELLQKHFAKHKGKYESITVAEYVRQADALANEIESDDIVQLLRSDGSVSRYRFSTNDFIVVNSDGTIRTFFKPTKGKEYWQDELNRN